MKLPSIFNIRAAKADSEPRQRMALDEPIIEQTADERMLEIMQRERLPGDVNQTMADAIDGDLRYQGLLFETMLDTWPRLQGNLDEICGHVARNEIEIEPYREQGEDPTPSAIEKAAFVKASLDAMEVDYIDDYKDIEGTVYGIAMSYYTGHSVQEILWESSDKGITPEYTQQLPWRNFGYPYSHSDKDRLMLNRTGDYSFNTLEDFPENKFIVAIKKGHTGHAAQAAPIRALVTYWLGSIYGLKWLLNFSQIYGVPIRWANYSSSDDVGVIANMLKKIGSAGYAVMPPNTELKLIESSKSAQNLPQQALMDNADKACDIFILGQTLTSDVGSSGSQALGNVHNEIRLDVVDRVGDYVAKVLKGSLIKDLLTLNYGDDSEMPRVSIRCKRAKDAKGLAERDKVLREAFPDLEWSEEQLREVHDIAKPLNKEDTIGGVVEGVEEEIEEDVEVVKKEEVAASQAAIQAAQVKANINKLSDNVMESLTQVSSQWLGGVKPTFDRLADLALSGNATDDDFLKTIEAASTQLPELFGELDTQSLQQAFEESIGTALMAGVADKLGV